MSRHSHSILQCTNQATKYAVMPYARQQRHTPPVSETATTAATAIGSGRIERRHRARAKVAPRYERFDCASRSIIAPTSYRCGTLVRHRSGMYWRSLDERQLNMCCWVGRLRRHYRFRQQGRHKIAWISKSYGPGRSWKRIDRYRPTDRSGRGRSTSTAVQRRIGRQVTGRSTRSR